MSVLLAAASAAATCRVNVGGLTAPAQAAAEGFTSLVFQEEFDDLSGIDVGDTRQPGFNFYVDPPFGFPQTTEYSVANSVLTGLGPGGTASTSFVSTVGTGFPNWTGFGAVGGFYAEISWRFPDPTFTTPSPGWPAFWTMSNEHLWGTMTADDSGFGEIDFEEYIFGDGTLTSQNIHYWGDPHVIFNPSINPPGTVDFSQFHTFGCLWVFGDRIQAYFNDTLVQTATYASNIPWMANVEGQSMPIIIGGDPPCVWEVDWIRVWQAP